MRLSFASSVILLLLSFGLTNPTAAQDQPKDVPRPETYYGLWRDGDGKPLFIERHTIDDPTSSKYVLAKTLVKDSKEAREWRGFYDDGKLYLRYRPAAEEMNHKLPLWVRKAAYDKQLVWRLEIAAIAACGAEDTVTIKWFPGAIEWDEGAAENVESVKLVGDGDPVEAEYKRHFEAEVEFTSAPSMGIYASPTAFVDSADVKYITTHERFRLEVILPRAQADKQGQELSVEFKAKETQRTTKVALQRAPVDRLAGVRYTQADSIKVETLESILPNYYGDTRQDYLGSVVTASFGDVSRTVRIFKTDTVRAIFRIYDALTEHEAIWLNRIQSPSLSTADKEDAQQRLRLVRNAKMIASSDALYDYRLAILTAYLSADGKDGLLVRDNLTWLHGTSVGQNVELKLKAGGTWKLGFSWASKEEEAAVLKAYGDAATIKAKEVAKASIFAIYDFVATSTGGDKVVMVLFGIDQFGRRVETIDRVGAIGRFFVPDPSNPLDWVKFARGSASFASAARRLGAAAKGLDTLGHLSNGPLPPGVLSRTRLAAAKITTEGVADCFEEFAGASLDPGHAHRAYPKSFKLLPGGAKPEHGQEFKSGCVIGTIQHVHEEQTGRRLSQPGIKKYLELELVEHGEDLEKIAVARGVTGRELERTVHATGGDVVSVRLEPAGISAIHENSDWGIVLRIQPKGGPKHAIVLKAIERDAVTNKQKRIIFFDPDVKDPATGKKGHLVYTDTPCDFWNLLYRSPDPDSPTAFLVRWRISTKVTGK